MSEHLTNFTDSLVALIVGLRWLWSFLAVLVIAVLAINGGVAAFHKLDRTGANR